MSVQPADGESVASIGMDSWAVDCGLPDADGALLATRTATATAWHGIARHGTTWHALQVMDVGDWREFLVSVRGSVVKVAVAGILVVGSIGLTAGSAQAGTCRNWLDLAHAYRDLFVYDNDQILAAGGNEPAAAYWQEQANVDFANWKLYEGRFNTCNTRVP